MNSCNNTRTIAHGHTVKCGDTVFGEGSPIYVCEECLKEKNSKMRNLLRDISQSNCRTTEFYDDIVELIGDRGDK